MLASCLRQIVGYLEGNRFCPLRHSIEVVQAPKRGEWLARIPPVQGHRKSSQRFRRIGYTTNPSDVISREQKLIRRARAKSVRFTQLTLPQWRTGLGVD